MIEFLAFIGYNNSKPQHTLSREATYHPRDGARRGPSRQGLQGLAREILQVRKTIQEEIQMKYVCTVCGWVYDEEEKGVKWEDLPEDFVCELCGVGKDMFEAE